MVDRLDRKTEDESSSEQDLYLYYKDRYFVKILNGEDDKQYRPSLIKSIIPFSINPFGID